MLTPAHTESFAPSAGLIASLATTTWLDTTPTGATLCCLLLVPQPPRSCYETPAVIEQRMRTVAEALRLDGTPYRKRIPTGRPWSLLLGQGTPVALVLGLDPPKRYPVTPYHVSPPP